MGRDAACRPGAGDDPQMPTLRRDVDAVGGMRGDAHEDVPEVAEREGALCWDPGMAGKLDKESRMAIQALTTRGSIFDAGCVRSATVPG